jgi:acylphosphatase
LNDFQEAPSEGSMSNVPREKGRASITVSGRVQGVAFRAYTREEATILGLSGWVKNLPAGTVQVVAEGDRDKVEALIDWCREGPPAAQVDGVEVTWESPRGEIGGFQIRR